MTTKHLLEQEMQQYAMDKSGCDRNMIAHIETCKTCQASVEVYIRLFSELHKEPKPVFGFDLPGLVLQQLPKPASKFSLNIFFACLFALAAIVIPAWLFRKYLVNMFTGILPVTVYLMVITVAAILLFQGIESYRKYQKLLSALN